MSKAGDVFENPVTGERGVTRIGTEESPRRAAYQPRPFWAKIVHTLLTSRFVLSKICKAHKA
jgi:hypothetical protein